MASVIRSSCTSCGACEPICPTLSITPGAKKYVIDSDTCTSCELCVPICPVDAIKPEKKLAPKKAG